MKVEVDVKKVEKEISDLIQALETLRALIAEQRDSANDLDMPFLALSLDNVVRVIKAYKKAFKLSIEKIKLRYDGK